MVNGKFSPLPNCEAIWRRGAGGEEYLTVNYIEIRKQIDDDWTRLAIILFSVALVTLISGLLLLSKKVRKEYKK